MLPAHVASKASGMGILASLTLTGQARGKRESEYPHALSLNFPAPDPTRGRRVQTPSQSRLVSTTRVRQLVSLPLSCCHDLEAGRRVSSSVQGHSVSAWAGVSHTGLFTFTQSVESGKGCSFNLLPCGFLQPLPHSGKCSLFHQVGTPPLCPVIWPDPPVTAVGHHLGLDLDSLSIHVL